jgi:hypothetical protein
MILLGDSGQHLDLCGRELRGQAWLLPVALSYLAIT